jgi:hypothetical protein
MFRFFRPATLIGTLALGWSNQALADDLAKASQNPVGDLISVPLELSHFGDLPGNSSATVLLAKPVYPLNLGKVNLVNRLIVPFAWVDANLSRLDLGNDSVPPDDVNRNGFANVQYQGFLTPANPGGIIWGLGPALEMPTNTNDLGSDKWSAGPAAVVLAIPGNWVLGVLAQNLWSFAGSDSANDTNKLTLQYFLNYNMPDGWFLTSSPIITADWNKSSDNRWTVPVGGGIGKLMRFGKQPVNLTLKVYKNVIHSDAGPEWSVYAGVSFLFPK